MYDILMNPSANAHRVNSKCMYTEQSVAGWNFNNDIKCLLLIVFIYDNVYDLRAMC